MYNYKLDIMKTHMYYFALILISLISYAGYSQSIEEPEALGLPGDNLNLYAVLDIFQNSATIEKFEETLNNQNNQINNLDLNNDGKVDFIKVKTEQDGNNFMFILQDELNKNDMQDLAVIFVDKDRNNKISVQIVGDENLYGKNYVVEPNSLNNATNTINPAYSGSQAVESNATSVSITTSPVVLYLYSPVYAPYYPPYYYGYYPHYFRPWTPLYFNVYYRNNYHYNGNYYRPTYYPHHYNRYYSGRSTSVVVINNTRNGNYNKTYNGNNYRKPNNPVATPRTRTSTMRQKAVRTSIATRPTTTRPVTRSSTTTRSMTAKPSRVNQTRVLRQNTSSARTVKTHVARNESVKRGSSQRSR